MSTIGTRPGRSIASRARARRPSRSSPAPGGVVTGAPPSATEIHLGIEREEELGVDDRDHRDRDQAGDDRLVHRTADALGAAADLEALERGDDPDDHPEQDQLRLASPEVDEA